MRNQIEITKRELIFSFAIVLFMVIIGVVIADKIHDSEVEESEKYFKALKIKSEDMFEYAIKTSVGDLLAEGTFEAIKPVKYNRLDGEYLYIREEEEHYVKKTREVSYSCGDSTCYRTETYWEWEYYDERSKHVEEFKFLGQTFNYERVAFTNVYHVDTISGGHHVRYQYYAVPKKFKGSLFANTKSGTITNTRVHAGRDIEKVIEEREKAPDRSVSIFWITWGIFIAFIIAIFVVMENKYLNNKR